MPTIDVTINEKTYHVDIPWLGVRPLPVIVDGQPCEICIGGEQDVELRREWQTSETVPGTMADNLFAPWSSGHTTCKPVKALWHATIREE